MRGFHKSDLRARVTDLANGGRYADYATTVSVADDNVPGVRVLESDGSTNVIEFTDGDFGLTKAAADTGKFPYQDSYALALTMAPAIGETVTVTATAQPTRTSQTGGIVSFSQQVVLCLIGGGETCTDPSHFSDIQLPERPEVAITLAHLRRTVPLTPGLLDAAYGVAER